MMIAIGAEINGSFTDDEVRSCQRELNNEEEFDEQHELNEAVLAAVSGGETAVTHAIWAK